MCPELDVECLNTSNGCFKRLKRREIAAHLSICSAMVERKYDYNQLPKPELGKFKPCSLKN